MQNSIKKPKNIRQNNGKLMLDLYLNNRVLTVPQIAEQLGLSRTTIFKINDQLINLKLIRSVGKGDSTKIGGKKPERYSLNKHYGYGLTFYIAYDFLEVTLFNLHLKIELQKRVPFERNSNLEVISELIKKEYDTIVEQKSKANILGITIAVHALVNTKTDICVHAIYFPSWGINIPLAQIISEKLETDIPIYVDSWIWLKTQIAFKYYPIVADVDSFVLIYSGRNGFVTGIYNRDNISESNSHLIGEIGHMIVNPNDKQMCQCGGYGCVESLTDIKRIIQNGNAERENYPNSQIFKNGEVTFDAIIKAFKEDDPLAVKLLDETASWVAIAISNLNLILFPDIVLFEGEICLAGKKWYKMVEEKLEKVSLVRFKNKINLKFVEPNFEAIAEGSAYYIFNQFIKNIYPNLK